MPTAANPASRPLWHWTVAAAAVTAVSLWLTWTFRGLPTLCPAIYPAPASCGLDPRHGPALWGTVCLAGLFTAFLATGAVVRPERRQIVLRGLMAVLVVAAVAVPLWTLGSSGFSL